VTSDATTFRLGAAGHVLRVIEAHVEAFFEAIRKGFAWRVGPVDILMTNRAQRNIRCGELRQMATGAIFVTRKAGTRGVVIAVMTT
jgi:hypothetical protein